MNRELILAALLCGIIVPLSLQRNMGALSGVNAVGAASLLALLAGLIVLAGGAVAVGAAHALPLTPNLEELGGEGRGASAHALAILNVVSVLLTACGCHFNVSMCAAILVAC